MPKIIFSKHARYQLKERNISRQVIIKSFKKPDKIIQQAHQRYQLIKVVKQRDRKYLLIVVFDQKNFTKEIVTAFITSKVNKYL